MRIVLVGRPDARARLRRALAGTPLDIVDEAPTLAAARERDAEADGFLLAADESSGGPERSALRGDIPVEALTPRELDVLQLLAEGLPNKALARRLAISDQTVKFHVAAICGKLGAVNRTDAVRIGFQRGLVVL